LPRPWALRTQAGTAQFTNSVLGLIADSGNGARYTRLPGGALISQQLTGGPSASRYYITDRQNSIIALLDSTGSGTTVANYYYSPYGETTATGASSNNPFRYISGYQDTATGLYKLGVRYYDPSLGRFTQQDPTGKEANLYLYASSNPSTRVDPTGQSAIDIGGCFGFGYVACYGVSLDSDGHFATGGGAGIGFGASADVIGRTGTAAGTSTTGSGCIGLEVSVCGVAGGDSSGGPILGGGFGAGDGLYLTVNHYFQLF